MTKARVLKIQIYLVSHLQKGNNTNKCHAKEACHTAEIN